MGVRNSKASRLLAGLSALAVVFLTHSERLRAQDAGEAFFEKKIRPVLLERCVECHGEKKQESGLRLDTRKGLLRGGERGPAFVPGGNVEASLLLQALRHENDLEMPPNDRLPQPVVDAFKTWLAGGATWPSTSVINRSASAKSHWAFQPIQRVAPPASTSQGTRSPIDSFILQSLESRGLAPSDAADRRSQLRRLTFDLVGLPPSSEQMQAFLKDERPDAYERQVDRLLASPHFGERWGRYWLDVARYADNKGYVFFEEKNYPWAYTYRDYVIESLNADLGYDRFLMEQIAADQLGGQQLKSLRAMGFLTIGARFMNNTHDVVDDRIDVVTRGVMGLTVTCARCHDHKYDPVSQEDYYALYGVFRSSEEPLVPPTFLAPQENEAGKTFSEGLRERLDKLTTFVDEKHHELVQGAKARADEYLMAAHAVRNHPPTDDFMLITDKGALNPTMITRWRIYLEKQAETGNPVWTPWRAMVDVDDASFAAEAPAILKAIPPAKTNKLVMDRLQAKPLESRQAMAARYAELFREIADQHPESAESSDSASSAEAIAVLEAIRGPDAPASVPKTMGWGFLTLLPDRASQNDFKKLLKEVEQWSMTHEAAPPRAMILVDADRLYHPRVFQRGNPHRLGAFTERRFLELFNPSRKAFRDGSGRKELAEAVVAESNPLTARVIANRVWAKLFGRGLAPRPDDFGIRSEPPSHPELLDWLATDLRDSGWSLKSLIRTIVCSSAYRQSSQERAQAMAADPENRWLWRMRPRRRDFESLRDAMLVAAGELDRTLGGPSLRLLERNAVLPRRTVYAFIDRMDVDPLLTTFDFPNPIATSSERVQTTTAAQSLFFMNSRFALSVADKIAARPDLQKLEADARVQRLFQLLYSRPASDEERQWSAQLLGENPDLNNWRRFVHALLMSNEFLYVN